ncbi:Sister chromatid cohesion protein [Yarrowia sp. C11]|nr:Sister chromatid cohesion protein [Yarrowia sp. E02]KAG5369779.1 Sister chromatid cohesion protein [Yarrowia sp. C11]
MVDLNPSPKPLPRTAGDALKYTPLMPFMPVGRAHVPVPKIHTTIPVVLEEYPADVAHRAETIAAAVNQPGGNEDFANRLLMQTMSALMQQDMSYLQFKGDEYVLGIGQVDGAPEPTGPRLAVNLSPSSTFLVDRLPLHQAARHVTTPRVSKLSQSFLDEQEGGKEQNGQPPQVTTQSGGGQGTAGPSAQVMSAPGSSAPQVMTQSPQVMTPQAGPQNPAQNPQRATHTEPVAPVQQRASHPAQPASHTVPSLTPQKVQDMVEKSMLALLEQIFDADDSAESYDYDYDALPDKSLWQRPIKRSLLPLSTKTLLQLQDTLRRSVGREFFLKIDLDDLLRLERICARSLSHMNVVDLSIPLAEKSDRDMALLMEAATNSLRAADVVLRIVNSPRQENQLFSENILSSVAEDLSTITEHLLLPVVGQSTEECGTQLASWRQNLESTVATTMRVVDLFCKSIYLRPLDESTITKILFMSVKILFMESVTGGKGVTHMLSTMAVESFRSSAMEVLAVTFASFPDQQAFILDEILTSMQKLPSGKSHARQFRVGNVSIQTVSALLMRLIGSCGGYKFSFDQTTKLTRDSPAIKQFEEACEQATANAQSSATNAVHYLIEKAAKTAKTSESPYRALLDLFVEDFINVYGQLDWIAGELILHTFVRVCCDFLSAPEKQQPAVVVLALCMDILGTIGCHVLSFRKKCLEQAGITREEGVEDLQHLSMSAHYVLRTLNDVQTSNPFQETVRKYFVSQWGNILGGYHDNPDKDVAELAQKKLFRLAASCSENVDMTKSMTEETSSRSHDALDSANDISRILLHMPLAESYNTILATICHCLEQSKIQIRSRALKSLTTLLSYDPKIMQLPYVANSLKSRLVDASASVRDAAVEIVGKYVLLQPTKTTQYFESLFERVSDMSLGVRKRVLRLLRDLYATDIDSSVKLEIIEKLLYRTEDEEESVQELATSTLKEMWFVHAKFEDAQTMVATLKKSEQLAQYLARFLDSIFNPFLHKDPIPEATLSVGTQYISLLVKHVVGGDNTTQTESYLELLGYFVEANVLFISQNQLTSLRGYISADVKDLSTYHVLKIFETAMVSSRIEFSDELLKDIETSMLKKLTKFNVKELSVAVPCLWAVCSKRKDTKKLETATLSCVKALLPHVQHLKAGKLTEAPADPKFKRLIYLVGTLGRYCNFEDAKPLFQKLLGAHVSGKPDKSEEFIAGLFLLFCDPKLASQEIVRLAVRNLLSVCIGFPQLFMMPEIIACLDMALAGDEELQNIVLKQFSAFLENEELMATKAGLKGAGNTDASGQVDIGVLHGTTSKFVNDGVCASIVQRYLNSILQIAVLGTGAHSISAILLLEKVSHQGFANPRLLMTTTVALEASPVSLVASKAQGIHRLFHEKHESLIDGTYVDGIGSAADYLRRLLGPKLAQGSGYLDRFFNVIKGSRSSRRKLFLNMTRALELDETQTNDEAVTNRLWTVIFLCRALSTLELSTLEDAHMIVHSLNSAVSKSGDLTSAKVAVTVQLMAALRRFIKMAYSLTDAKCAVYAPARGGQIGLKELNKQAIRSAQAPASGMDFSDTFLDFNYAYDDPERNAHICQQVRQMLQSEASDEVHEEEEEVIEEDQQQGPGQQFGQQHGHMGYQQQQYPMQPYPQMQMGQMGQPQMGHVPQMHHQQMPQMGQMPPQQQHMYQHPPPPNQNTDFEPPMKKFKEA